MLDRTVAPPFVKSSSFNLITPQELKLPNGISLFSIPGGSQEVLKLELIFEAGRWFEEKTAASYFTAQLLSKGTKEKSSFDIAQIFDQYGAHLEVNPGLDFVSISLYSLTRNLEPVIRVLSEIMAAPAFPRKELEQLQSIFIQNLNINKEKTSYVASQVFRKNLFGHNHPYGVEVTEADVAALETETLRNHFNDFFHSPKVFASGKIDSRSQGLIEETLRDFSAPKTPPTIEHALTSQPENQYLEKKDSVQSSVRIGKRSLSRAHPDYAALLFVNHILGGYFGSRLMKNIREEKGLTYGISASVHGLLNESYLVIGADVNKQNVKLTFDEIRKELKNLRTTIISADELETSRNHFIGSLQAEISTPFAHADKIKTIVLHNLGKDHYQNMITRVESITAPEISEIGERYFQEESFYQVAVG